MTLWAKIFQDKYGNEFFVPKFSWQPDANAHNMITPYRTETEVLIEATQFATKLGLKMHSGARLLEQDDSGHIVVPHIATELISPYLVHNRTNVYVIAGPMFNMADEVGDGRE